MVRGLGETSFLGHENCCHWLCFSLTENTESLKEVCDLMEPFCRLYGGAGRQLESNVNAGDLVILFQDSREGQWKP